MSVEFFIRFESVKWYQINHQIIIDYLCSLSCFVKENTNEEFWLLGQEDRNNAKRWEFDMRLFFREAYIYVEISSHPETVSKDLSQLLKWIREQTFISVEDEDGESSGW